MKIVLIDNYDSFTYNVVHLIESLIEENVTVIRNDKLHLTDIKDFDKIILSPGPGVPKDAGLLLDIIKHYAPIKSILGVCLGHQAIGEAFGANLINLKQVYHGIATDCMVIEKEAKLLKHLKPTFTIGRYHSWVIDEATLSKDLTVTARDAEGQIMALQHKQYDLHGVQFHPESILTPDGKLIMGNFLGIKATSKI